MAHGVMSITVHRPGKKTNKRKICVCGWMESKSEQWRQPPRAGPSSSVGPSGLNLNNPLLGKLDPWSPRNCRVLKFPPPHKTFLRLCQGPCPNFSSTQTMRYAVFFFRGRTPGRRHVVMLSPYAHFFLFVDVVPDVEDFPSKLSSKAWFTAGVDAALQNEGLEKYRPHNYELWSSRGGLGEHRRHRLLLDVVVRGGWTGVKLQDALKGLDLREGK